MDSAISAYVINSKFVAVLLKPVRDFALREYAKNRLGIKNPRTRVGHNTSLTSWRDLIRIVLLFYWSLPSRSGIVYYKKEDH